MLAGMFLATTARAAMLPPADSEVGFDVILNVPEVQAIALDAATGSLYAAVAPFSGVEGTASDIVRWHLDPIRLGGIWPAETLVSDLAVSPAGLVYAAGQTAPASDAKGSSAPRGGMVISLDPNDAAAPIQPIVQYGNPNTRATSRFNQVAFDGKGVVYMASPTLFNILAFPDRHGQLKQATSIPQLMLKCGAPAQLSLFSAGAKLAYAASTTDGALLETGTLGAAPDDQPGATADCFRVTNVFGYKEAPPTLNSVVHAVLTDPDGNADAVLALEPNTGILHLLRLDPETRQLSRAGWADLDAAAGQAGASDPGTFNLLAASGDGAVIFVGGPAKGDILRFQREGDDLVQLGLLRSGPGLKGMEISPDGAQAVLVMRDTAGLDRIHVIRAPAGLGDGTQALPRGGNTLRQVQSELDRLGFDVGVADGILGPRTLTAIDRLRQGNIAESDRKGVELMIGGVLLTRRPQERSY